MFESSGFVFIWSLHKCSFLTSRVTGNPAVFLFFICLFTVGGHSGFLYQCAISMTKPQIGLLELFSCYPDHTSPRYDNAGASLSRSDRKPSSAVFAGECEGHRVVG